ncbi:hypothetical protein Salat_2519400 [Sesamum alatum]|uniref:Uncharacterized protein n=1 Tax=Sesamum alatum TaxID=300844 RepID=A0AAE1XSS6_9LAMI|nr:hypothetical protein Salat_2519400 [Sesamum alatum]
MLVLTHSGHLIRDVDSEASKILTSTTTDTHEALGNKQEIRKKKGLRDLIACQAWRQLGKTGERSVERHVEADVGGDQQGIATSDQAADNPIRIISIFELRNSEEDTLSAKGHPAPPKEREF